MNESTTRSLLIAGLSANVLFLMLTLLDYSLGDSRYMWPLFVGWAFVVLLMVILAFVSSGYRVAVRREEPSRPAVVAAPVAASVPLPRPAAVPVAQPPRDAVPFTYNGYTLYSRKVELKNGGERTIWFFSKRRPASGSMAAKPPGFHVGVNERTGLPFLKKGAGQDGEDLTPHVEAALRPQCGALTEDGKQCRNSSRADSKYCASHFGYQPTAIGQAEAARRDTRARVRDAPDTLPSVRRKVAD
ncbi:MAG TPA: hypothetical protein VJ874_01980 [Candidatus Thermoplasmatota archaeon]|nr:hypothetical protein [Candidatus Thermoplasmatota archaeon]